LHVIYKEPNAAPQDGPVGVVDEAITVYKQDGAEQFLSELRANVRDCPQGKRGSSTYKYRSLGSAGVGDASVLIEGSTPARGDDGELSGSGSTYLYLAAVRVGDSVTLLEVSGWESISGERSDAESLTRKAAKRLGNWRG
jgi:hypothetical protein